MARNCLTAYSISSGEPEVMMVARIEPGRPPEPENRLRLRGTNCDVRQIKIGGRCYIYCATPPEDCPKRAWVSPHTDGAYSKGRLTSSCLGLK